MNTYRIIYGGQEIIEAENEAHAYVRLYTKLCDLMLGGELGLIVSINEAPRAPVTDDVSPFAVWLKEALGEDDEP